jgi:large subunit ribosomal protein L19
MATKVNSPVNTADRAKLVFSSGDTVRVWSKIEDKGKTRLQAFEGLVLARKHGAEAGATFTVRKVSNTVGVERIFPLYSPNIDKIEVVKRANVRRSKLYYVREKAAKEISKKMKMYTLKGIQEEEVAEEATAE